MKLSKKIMTLLLAAVLMLSMSVTAFAETNPLHQSNVERLKTYQYGKVTVSGNGSAIIGDITDEDIATIVKNKDSELYNVLHNLRGSHSGRNLYGSDLR